MGLAFAAATSGCGEERSGLPDEPSPSARSATPGPATDEPTGARPPGGESSPSGTSERNDPSKALPRRTGVIFVHGTGDQGDVADLKCEGAGDDWRCVVQAAVDNYWSQENVDIQRTRLDDSKRPYLVVGCPLGSRVPWSNASPVKRTNVLNGDEPGSADCVAAQSTRFLRGPDDKAGTEDDVTDVAIVTHSGGSNVVRYLLRQFTAKDDFAKVKEATRRVIGLAAPTHGTYLADWAFERGSLASTANAVVGFFGGEGFYNDDGVAFIRTEAMRAANRDPAKFGAIEKDIHGIPWLVGSGTYPHAFIADSASYCGGYSRTVALQALHERYLSQTDPTTFRDGCSDGFITCQSAMDLVEDDPSRIVFGRRRSGSAVGKVDKRAHNQSLLNCDGIAQEVRAAINQGSMPTTLAEEKSLQTKSLVPTMTARQALVWEQARRSEVSARVPAMLDGGRLTGPVVTRLPDVRSLVVQAEPRLATARTALTFSPHPFVSADGTERAADLAALRDAEARFGVTADTERFTGEDVVLEVRFDGEAHVEVFSEFSDESVPQSRALVRGTARVRVSTAGLPPGVRWLRVRATPTHATDVSVFVDVPVNLAAPVARVVRVGTPERDESGDVWLPVRVESRVAGRFGVSASAALYVDGVPRAAFESAEGFDLTPGTSELRVRVAQDLRASTAEVGITKLALVRHDDASTVTELHGLGAATVRSVGRLGLRSAPPSPAGADGSQPLWQLRSR